MKLIIDAGNTKIKVAIFQGDTLSFLEEVEKENISIKLKQLLDKYKISKSIISSVSSLSEKDLELIKKISPNLLVLTSNTNIPFKNKYKTPKTLGVDRIGLVSSAVYQYPNENVLVIDAGTCITYDYVNTKAQYFGGSISPGIIMRYKALNNFTAKLPMLDLEFPESLIGISTNQSIHSGVIFGVLGEINAIINRYKDQNEKLTVVLTGGDANFLAKRLKNGIFANPNFLLEGLNAILNYNS